MPVLLAKGVGSYKCGKDMVPKSCDGKLMVPVLSAEQKIAYARPGKAFLGDRCMARLCFRPRHGYGSRDSTREEVGQRFFFARWRVWIAVGQGPNCRIEGAPSARLLQLPERLGIPLCRTRRVPS